MTWINVEDRLPNREGEYLVWLEKPLQHGRHVFFSSYANDRWLGINGSVWPGMPKPSHWQPLPPPPGTEPAPAGDALADAEVIIAGIFNVASHAYEMQEGSMMDVSNELGTILQLIRKALPGRALSDARDKAHRYFVAEAESDALAGEAVEALEALSSLIVDMTTGTKTITQAEIGARLDQARDVLQRARKLQEADGE